jgi:2-oxoglutarate ferredoxin oxidoreductase subunit beta
MVSDTPHGSSTAINSVGMSRSDYKGAASTLCQGCGHNSVTNQIIAACYEMNIRPEKTMKFSGIGCSSKSITYFLGSSFGFNGLHGRMPSVAQGAGFGDTSIKMIGISGDGDTASIGFSQFKHMSRRNIPILYVVENNGVYGLTKGQFSATAERGKTIKKQGTSRYLPVDIAMEALISNASFVARSFAGDPKQVKELIKAGLSHNGIAVIDIISPCVTFYNQETSMHSYSWGKDHESPIHAVSYVPPRDEIMVEDFEANTIREIELHDGSMVLLKKIDRDYDPTNRWDAMHLLEDAHKNDWLITGLIYVDPDQPSMYDLYKLVDKPLNRLTPEELRPSRESLENLNQMML